MSQTLEQKRAKHALNCIDEIIKKNQLKEKYSTFVSRMPTMILNNGLGQALAFLLSKSENKEDAAKTFYNQLQAWLCGSDGIYPEGNLIRLLMDNDRKKYIHAQSETLALLNWMKKFSDAYLVEHKKEVKVDAPSV